MKFYLSPETSDETALKTICRYELKVKITTPSLKNILNYTFSMVKNRFFLCFKIHREKFSELAFLHCGKWKKKVEGKSVLLLKLIFFSVHFLLKDSKHLTRKQNTKKQLKLRFCLLQAKL